MEQWEYAITVHSAGEILSRKEALPARGEERVVYCGAEEGTCFFDRAPNPYLEAMLAVLNERGQEGWVLVQVVLRTQDMICFWRRPRQGDQNNA